MKSTESEDGSESLPEVRAGLVFVKPKNVNSYNEAGGETKRWVLRRTTWVMPLLRATALLMSMLCIMPRMSTGTSLVMKDSWPGDAESDQHDSCRLHR